MKTGLAVLVAAVLIAAAILGAAYLQSQLLLSPRIEGDVAHVMTPTFTVENSPPLGFGSWEQKDAAQADSQFKTPDIGRWYQVPVPPSWVTLKLNDGTQVNCECAFPGLTDKDRAQARLSAAGRWVVVSYWSK